MRHYISLLFLLFAFAASAQVKVDSVNIIEGTQVPTSTLAGDEIWNYLQGASGNRKWRRMTSQELKDYIRPCVTTFYSNGDTLFVKNSDCTVMYQVIEAGASEPSLEQFLNHSGSTVTVSGVLPTTNQNRTIRVTRCGVELIYNEDYTLSGNVFNFINPLDSEHIKIWYENQ